MPDPTYSSTSNSMSEEAQACQAMIADILEEAEGLDLLDLALLIMGTVHLEELLNVVEAAREMYVWGSDGASAQRFASALSAYDQLLPQGEPE